MAEKTKRKSELLGTEKMECPICGKKHWVEKREREENATIRGAQITYKKLFFRCRNGKGAGKEFVTDELLRINRSNERKAYLKIKNVH